MKFGVFDYIEKGDEPIHRTYNKRMDLLRALEAASFYG